MKGYYQFSIGRNRNKNTTYKYTLVCYKDFTTGLSPEDADVEWAKTTSGEIGEGEYYYGTTDFLIRKFNMQRKIVFSVDSNWPTASRIWHSIEKFLPNGLTESKWGYHFKDKPGDFIRNSKEFLSDEEFLQILQSALDSLPPRTFSKKNRQKVIDSYMNNF